MAAKVSVGTVFWDVNPFRRYQIVFSTEDVLAMTASTPVTFFPGAAGYIPMLHSIVIHKEAGTAYTVNGGAAWTVRLGAANAYFALSGSTFMTSASEKIAIRYQPSSGNDPSAEVLSGATAGISISAGSFSAGTGAVTFEVTLELLRVP